jgi:hypothetical protein
MNKGTKQENKLTLQSTASTGYIRFIWVLLCPLRFQRNVHYDFKVKAIFSAICAIRLFCVHIVLRKV